VAHRPFIAITLYVFTSDSEGYEPLYREDVSLIYAASEEHAREIAEANSRAEQGTHKNETGDDITLTPRAVIDVSAALTDDLSAGGDLYSRHFRDFDAYSKWETMLCD
jgi:aconitase B